MRLLFIFLLSITTVRAYSQSKPDLKEIKRLTHDSTSRYYYDKLVNEFQSSPESFNENKAVFLYYGKLYSKYYRSFPFLKPDIHFTDLMAEGKYKDAIAAGEELLASDPVNLRTLMMLMVCYMHEKNLKADDVKKKIEVLGSAILISGDGTSPETAYSVISVPDESVLMDIQHLTPVEQSSFEAKGTDETMALSMFDSQSVKEEHSHKERTVYFEVFYPLDAFGGKK